MTDIDQAKLDDVAPVRDRVRRALEVIIWLRDMNYTSQEIADYLNEMDHQTARGLAFTRANVARIIAREGRRDGKNQNNQA